MYKVIIKTDIPVLMRSPTDFQIIRIDTYKRAEGRGCFDYWVWEILCEGER